MRSSDSQSPPDLTFLYRPARRRVDSCTAAVALADNSCREWIFDHHWGRSRCMLLTGYNLQRRIQFQSYALLTVEPEQ